VRDDGTRLGRREAREQRVVEDNAPARAQAVHIRVGRACAPARIDLEDLAREWEWEETPEVSLKIVDSVDQAAALFNRYSPQFDASLIAEDPLAHRRFFEGVNAPFVGDGFTRWVDGQYAFDRPELGLSNWEHGRLFARGGVLAGDGVFTVRTRARQANPGLRR